MLSGVCEMSFWGIEPEDWFRRFFGSGGGSTRAGRGWRGGGYILREFGNVRSPGGPGGVSAPGSTRAQLRAEREPLADVVTSDKEVKVVVEMPGIDKKDIKVNIYDNSVEIFTTDISQRKYRRVVELPEETELETAKSTYRNGILEITFSKKEPPKQKGKQINIE